MAAMSLRGGPDRLEVYVENRISRCPVGGEAEVQPKLHPIVVPALSFLASFMLGRKTVSSPSSGK